MDLVDHAVHDVIGLVVIPADGDAPGNRIFTDLARIDQIHLVADLQTGGVAINDRVFRNLESGGVGGIHADQHALVRDFGDRSVNTLQRFLRLLLNDHDALRVGPLAQVTLISNGNGVTHVQVALDRSLVIVGEPGGQALGPYRNIILIQFRHLAAKDQGLLLVDGQPDRIRKEGAVRLVVGYLQFVSYTDFLLALQFINRSRRRHEEHGLLSVPDDKPVVLRINQFSHEGLILSCPLPAAAQCEDHHQNGQYGNDFSDFSVHLRLLFSVIRYRLL